MLSNVFYTLSYDSTVAQSEMSQKFLEAYHSKYGADAAPSDSFALGFDAYLLANQALSNVVKEYNANPPTDDELDDICINLSTRIYFAGGLCERLGIRDDIAKAVYKEAYHSNRSVIDKGTVADKDSLAELQSQQEAIISAAYTRAYKTMKAKVENAQELLQSCKKVLSRRMQEIELTKIGGSGR